MGLLDSNKILAPQTTLSYNSMFPLMPQIPSADAIQYLQNPVLSDFTPEAQEVITGGSDATKMPSWDDLKSNIVEGWKLGSGIGKAYEVYSDLKTKGKVAAISADIAEANAKLMDLGVNAAYRQRDAIVANLTARAGQIKAQQRAVFAARGVALGVGSTAEVAASTEIQKEEDKLVAEMNGLMSAWNYRRQGIMYRAKAEGLRYAAKTYSQAAPFAGALKLGSALTSFYGGL